MGRLAVVTGGGTGIGQAVARRLALGGDRVVIVGRREEVLVAAAEALNAVCGEDAVTWCAADLSEPGQVRSVAARIVAAGPVDVLVHSAGGLFASDTTTTLEATADGWRRDFDGNVLTCVLLTEALLPHLARPGGRIVAISSIAALRGAGSYGAAKAAVHAWVMNLATDLAPDQITVNAVAPGFVPETGIWEGNLTEEWVAERTRRIPLGRPGTPDEVAAAVAYLAAADAGWTTGQILQVNGGDLLGRG